MGGREGSAVCGYCTEDGGARDSRLSWLAASPIHLQRLLHYPPKSSTPSGTHRHSSTAPSTAHIHALPYCSLLRTHLNHVAIGVVEEQLADAQPILQHLLPHKGDAAAGQRRLHLLHQPHKAQVVALGVDGCGARYRHALDQVQTQSEAPQPAEWVGGLVASRVRVGQLLPKPATLQAQLSKCACHCRGTQRKHSKQH